MPEFHAEPYLHLAALSHQSALITWGAFYFKTRTHKQWKVVDDRDLRYVHPPRQESIGARSASYGPARVNVYGPSGTLAATAATDTTNFCWVGGLTPDTPYRYEVIVKDELWGHDQRWDWVPGEAQGLVQNGGAYVNEFRTFPDPAAPPAGPFTFMVLGDYGTGMRKSTPRRRQREIALAMQATFDTHDVRLIITAGDNIYAGGRILGLPTLASNTGDEDDDWFFTFFQPYRYMINRVPVYPCIGNHDTAETEEHDDRDQLLDNMYIRERIASDEASDRASIDPGLFYRFRFGRDVEFICLDTSKEGFFRGKRLFEYPKHWAWIERTLADSGVRWRLPFCHHPPFCAGPQHHNTDRMERLLPLFASGGVRAVFSGHEHNFQHSSAGGIDYFVTGAGSKVRKGSPNRFADAHTVSWSDNAHFLLVTIDGDSMTVRAIGEPLDGKPPDLVRYTPDGRSLTGPITLNR
jgi:tartrate-resistant acid phosphatase type 5